MPTILHVKHPLTPAKDAEKTIVAARTTLRNFLDARKFGYPVRAFINAAALDESEWESRELVDSDIVVVMPDVGDPFSAIFSFIATYWLEITVIASLAYTLTLDVPTFGAQDQGDPVYFLNGQRNQIKVGEPIECPYGRNRLWPSYAARPYNKFENNDQLLFQLFCLGQGEYDREIEQIEDTALANYDDIVTEFYGPGESVTLFPDNIVTSSEVAAIELFGPNEDDFPVGGYVGPFTANDTGTLTTILEWDVVLPRGLFRQENNGELTTLTVTADFEYREIDNAGAPIGSGATRSGPSARTTLRLRPAKATRSNGFSFALNFPVPRITGM